MEFQEKAKIRLEHWIKHDQGHLDEYREFVKQLEEAGNAESAKAMQEMAEHTEMGLNSLKKALAGLG
jgi:hypothetical protein